MKTISIWGSCVSRDIFNSIFVPNYKEKFQVIHDAQHCSVISMMAWPIKQSSAELVGDVTPFYKKAFKQDLSKEYLSRVLSKPPDILVMDFYSDVYYGAIEANYVSYITAKIWQYKKMNWFKDVKLGMKYSCFKNAEAFVDIWEKSFDNFMQLMSERCPETTIVINRAKFQNKLMNKKNNEVCYLSDVRDDRWTEKKIDQMNILWSKFDQYAIDNYGLDFLEFDDDKYLLDPDHRWGRFYVHYEKSYYTDTFDQLLTKC